MQIIGAVFVGQGWRGSRLTLQYATITVLQTKTNVSHSLWFENGVFFFNLFVLVAIFRAAEVAQLLRAVAVPPEDWGLIPNTYMKTHNHL